MKRIIVSGLALSCFLLPISAQEPSFAENTPESKSEKTAETASESSEENYNVTELQEFVVESSRLQIVDEGVVATPTKSEKNTSRDAASLIERMDIGIVYSDQTGIKARTGDGSVNIFINGVPADEMDLSTFWPSNALKVEFYPSSSDPRFMGKSNVLNFVMKEYQLGGLTKIDAEQQIPNSGDYSATSKFVYKDMTYNLMLKGSYDRDHQNGYEKSETFSDIWYEGNHYDLVERKSYSDEDVTRSDKLYAGLNARYLKGNKRITHQGKISWNRNPWSYNNGSVAYSPEIIDGNSMLSQSYGRALNMMLTGDYSFNLSKKLTIIPGWVFIYDHNNNLSNYKESSLPEIMNSSRENHYLTKLGLQFNYVPLSKISISGLFESYKHWYDTYYWGNTVARQKIGKEQTSAYLFFKYRPLDRLSFTLRGEAHYYNWRLDGNSTSNSWVTGILLNADYNHPKLGMFNLYLGKLPRYYTKPSSISSLILRQTELTWIEGNPHPATPTSYMVKLGYYNSPLKWFYIQLETRFSSTTNQEMISYRCGGKQYDGIIGKYTSSGSNNDLWINLSMRFRILGEKLAFKNEVIYYYMDFKESPLPSMNYFQDKAYLTSSLGNHYITASYRSPSKAYYNGGYTKSRRSGDYSLDYSYGNGNLFFYVRLDNIFHKHRIKTVTEENGPYKMVSRTWQTGRKVTIGLTYTFDYGKKVSPGFDIYESNNGSTSVLGK